MNPRLALGAVLLGALALAALVMLSTPDTHVAGVDDAPSPRLARVAPPPETPPEPAVAPSAPSDPEPMSFTTPWQEAELEAQRRAIPVELPLTIQRPPAPPDKDPDQFWARPEGPIPAGMTGIEELLRRQHEGFEACLEEHGLPPGAEARQLRLRWQIANEGDEAEVARVQSLELYRGDRAPYEDLLLCAQRVARREAFQPLPNGDGTLSIAWSWRHNRLP